KGEDINRIVIDKEDMYTGMGIVRAMPGPVFSIASFAGGMAWKDGGENMQLLGFIIGTIGIFLPSALLVLFFFPIWHNMKKYAAVYRAMEGINAVVVGIIFAATFYMMKDTVVSDLKMLLLNIAVVVGTWALLSYSRLPSPV